MGLKNSTYNLAYPIYGAKFLEPNILLVAGGGGRDQTAIPNKLTALRIDFNKKKIIKRFREITLDATDDSPTTLDAAQNVILMGCNQGPEKVEETGENHHLRKFIYEDEHLKFTASIDFDQSKNPSVYTKLTSISPNSSYAAITSSVVPSVIRIINPSDLSLNYEVETGRDVRDLHFSPDGQTLAYITAKSLEIVSIPSGQFTMRKTDFDSNWIFSKVRFITSNTVLIAATFETKPGAILLKITFQKGKASVIAQRQISTTMQSITALETDSQNEFIALATNENALAIIRMKDLTVSEVFKQLHDLAITRIAISPDSKLIASTSAAHTVNVISVNDRKSGFSSILNTIKKIFINFILVVIFAALANVAYKYDLHVKLYSLVKENYLDKRKVEEHSVIVETDVPQPYQNIITTTNIIENDIVSISSYTETLDTIKSYINTELIHTPLSPTSTLPDPVTSSTLSVTSEFLEELSNIDEYIEVSSLPVTAVSKGEPSTIETSMIMSQPSSNLFTPAIDEKVEETISESDSQPVTETKFEPFETFSFSKSIEMPSLNSEELSMLNANSEFDIFKFTKTSSEPSSTSETIVNGFAPSSSIASINDIKSSYSVISQVVTSTFTNRPDEFSQSLDHDDIESLDSHIASSTFDSSENLIEKIIETSALEVEAPSTASTSVPAIHISTIECSSPNPEIATQPLSILEPTISTQLISILEPTVRTSSIEFFETSSSEPTETESSPVRKEKIGIKQTVTIDGVVYEVISTLAGVDHSEYATKAYPTEILESLKEPTSFAESLDESGLTNEIINPVPHVTTAPILPRSSNKLIDNNTPSHTNFENLSEKPKKISSNPEHVTIPTDIVSSSTYSSLTVQVQSISVSNNEIPLHDYAAIETPSREQLISVSPETSDSQTSPDNLVPSIETPYNNGDILSTIRSKSEALESETLYSPMNSDLVEPTLNFVSNNNINSEDNPNSIFVYSNIIDPSLKNVGNIETGTIPEVPAETSITYEQVISSVILSEDNTANDISEELDTTSVIQSETTTDLKLSSATINSQVDEIVADDNNVELVKSATILSETEQIEDDYATYITPESSETDFHKTTEQKDDFSKSTDTISTIPEQTTSLPNTEEEPFDILIEQTTVDEMANELPINHDEL